MYEHTAWLPIALLCGLSACSGSDSSAPHAPPDESTVKEPGSRIYNGSCAACHQQDGRGVPGVYPSLAGSPVVLGDPSELTLWVLNGQRPRAMPAGRYAARMPQFGWMKEQDVSVLLTFLRSNFGNTAPGVGPVEVRRALAQ